MKQYEYEEMTVRQGRHEFIYEMDGQIYYDFMRAINAFGEQGWEFVCERMGKVIMKREIVEEQEESSVSVNLEKWLELQIENIEEKKRKTSSEEEIHDYDTEIRAYKMVSLFIDTSLV